MKKLLTFLMLSVLAIGVGWAETVEISISNTLSYEIVKEGTSGTGSEMTITSAPITITSNKGYLSGSNHIRVYGGGNLTVSSSVGTITKVEFTSTASGTSDNGPSKLSLPDGANGSYSYSGYIGTWIYEAGTSSVTFNANAQFRFNAVVVTYSSDTPASTYSIMVSGGTADMSEAYAGQIVTLTPNIPEGKVVDWDQTTVTPSSVIINQSDYTFTMPNEAVTIEFAFKDDPNAGKLFYESWSKTSGSGGNDGQWSGSIASSTVTSDINGWTYEKQGGADNCVKLGTGSAQGSATTPNISVENNKVYSLSFRAGAWSGDQTQLKLSASGATLYEDASCIVELTSVTMNDASFKDFTVYLKTSSTTLTITWQGKQASKSRFFLDEVLLEEAVVPEIATPVIAGETPFLTSTEVTITCATEGATIYYTTNGDDPTTSSTLYSAPFTINATTTVKAIAVKNGQTSNVASKIFTAIPTIGNIEDFNALELGDNFKYTASNLVAIKQYETTSTSGNKNYYLYAQNGEKGMLIFGNTGQTYQPGDVIPGGFTGTRAVFNGAPEMTNPAGFTASSQNVGLTPVEITPSQVNLDNFGRYAIIKNASFNTTNKIITAGNEEIPYHTTFMTPPTDGAVYDVIGICGYYKPNNGTAYPQFLPISATPAVTTGPDYYLIGSFNGWAQQDENYKFTALADGSYRLNNTMPDGVRFKILKVDGSDVAWLGGSAGDYFGITKDVCTNIQLVDGVDFYMAAGGICTFTISTDLKLTVGKEAQLFMKGSYSNDDWSTKTPLEATNTGWTITMDFDANTQFGFVDEWGNWHGGNGYLIKAEHMGDEIPMVGNGNYVFENASNYTLNINSELTKLVVTDNNVVIEGDYVKVTSNDQLSSGIYLIVYEDGSLAFDGGLETLDAVGNSIEVEIDDNVIPATDVVDAAAFTYDAIAKTLKSASGYYIGQTTDANGLKASQTTVYTNTISIDDDGNADVVSQGGAYLRYNATSGQTRFRYFKSDTYTSQKAIQLYKKGGEIVPTLDAPVIEGETPFVESTTVTITAEEGAAIYYTINGDTPSSESTHYEAPFQLTESATVKAIAIKGDIVSSVASKSFEKMQEIASATAFYSYEGNGEFVFTGNLVAIAQTGNYLYAQDDAKGVLIFGTIDQTYDMGDNIPAGFHAKKGAYHGAPQMAYPRGMQPSTEQATIEPVELTIAKATQDDQEYLYRYAVIMNATYQNGKLVDGEKEIAIFNRFTTETTPVEGKAYNVTGIVGWFDGAQFMPLEYELAPVVLEGVSFTADRHWATWCGEDMLEMPNDVTAYVVTGVSNGVAQIAEKEVVNSGEGVLLYCAGEKAEVKATVVTGATNAANNMLVGCLTATAVNVPAYVLYDNQFVLLQSGTTVGAHRCYLPMTSEAQGAPRLLIGDPGTVTGIEDLRYDSNGKPVGYYDLTGRYIGTSLNGKRGIFITSDGKKVVR